MPEGAVCACSGLHTATRGDALGAHSNARLGTGGEKGECRHGCVSMLTAAHAVGGMSVSFDLEKSW